MIRALAGLEPGEENNLEGLADNSPLKMDRRDILKRLGEGDAVVRGIPFDGQIHEDIPKDAWRQIYMEIRTGHPFAENYTGEDRPRRPGIGIVAVLRSGVDGHRKHAGGGWHHLVIDEDQLAALRAARRVEPTNMSPGSGAPGRPSSMHLVKLRLDELVAAGKSWPSRKACAEELAGWLKGSHPYNQAPTVKTIVNKLRREMPIARK